MKSIAEYLHDNGNECLDKTVEELDCNTKCNYSSKVAEELNELKRFALKNYKKPKFLHVTTWKKRIAKSKVGKRVVLVKYQAVYAYS